MLRRPSPTSPLAVLLIAGLGLGLAGCVPSEPSVTPPPSPSAEPVFASDEEALAAAEEAYAAFLVTTDTVIRDGGENPERVEPFLSPELYTREAAGYSQLAANGWHGVGATQYQLSLQSYDDDSVVAYSCDDVTDTDVVDSQGISIVREDRPLLVPYEVEFDVRDDMRIIRKDVWEGGGVC